MYKLNEPMKKIISVIVLSLIPFALMSQQDTHSSNEEEDVYFILSGEADKAIADGDYPTAVQRINEAIAIDPDNPMNVMLFSNLGIIHNFLDQDSLAMDAFDKALLIAPSMTVVLVNRGKLSLKTGNDKAAFEDFGKVIERDSTNSEALFYHGIIALYSGQLQIAEKDFMRLEQVAPSNHNTAVALASLYSMTEKNDQAIPYFQKLIAEDPQAEYYAGLAGCYIAIDDLTEASALLNEAMERFRDDPELYMYRAWLNKKRYLSKAARDDAQKAISLGADPIKVQRLIQDRHYKK